MTVFSFQLFAGFTILLISLVAGWIPIHARTKVVTPVDFNLGEALANGVFLGAALFHMLPDAESGLHQALGDVNYPYAYLFCALGFLILLFFEKVLFQRASLRKIVSPNLIPYTLTLMLSIHAFIAGTAVGINTTISAAFIIFIAIIAHKGFESFSLAVTLNRSELATNKIISIFVIFSLVTPFGILLGSVIANLLQTQTGLLTEAIFNAIAAGTFLYIATSHNIRERPTKQTNQLYEFLSLLLGVVVMALVAIWL